MKRYFFPDDKDSKSNAAGTAEDPSNDVTKQNNPGDNKEKKEEIEVPAVALEHYKESGKETEE